MTLAKEGIIVEIDRKSARASFFETFIEKSF
jgi:hypothetical protein